MGELTKERRGLIRHEIGQGEYAGDYIPRYVDEEVLDLLDALDEMERERDEALSDAEHYGEVYANWMYGLDAREAFRLVCETRDRMERERDEARAEVTILRRETGCTCPPNAGECSATIDMLRGDLTELQNALGMSEPWPVMSVLEKLCEAADALFDLGYDRLGWELVHEARKQGRVIVQRLRGEWDDNANGVIDDADELAAYAERLHSTAMHVWEDVTDCCYRCAWEATAGSPPAIMYVCSVCGNKRCPKATDHREECSGSNAVDQPAAKWLPWLLHGPRDANDNATTINPGVRRLVKLLNSLGWETCDSGDGATHDYDCDREYPYVVVRLPQDADLQDRSHRLVEDLEVRGVVFNPSAGKMVQANYSPNDRCAFIEVVGVTDADLTYEGEEE